MKCEFSMSNWVRGQLNIDKTPPIDLESRVFHRFFLNLSFKMDSHSPRRSFGWKIFIKFFFFISSFEQWPSWLVEVSPAMSWHVGFSTVVVRLWPWWTIALQLLPPHLKKNHPHPKVGKIDRYESENGAKNGRKIPTVSCPSTGSAASLSLRLCAFMLSSWLCRTQFDKKMRISSLWNLKWRLWTLFINDINIQREKKRNKKEESEKRVNCGVMWACTAPNLTRELQVCPPRFVCQVNVSHSIDVVVTLHCSARSHTEVKKNHHHHVEKLCVHTVQVSVDEITAIFAWIYDGVRLQLSEVRTFRAQSVGTIRSEKLIGSSKHKHEWTHLESSSTKREKKSI